MDYFHRESIIPWMYTCSLTLYLINFITLALIPKWYVHNLTISHNNNVNNGSLIKTVATSFVIQFFGLIFISLLLFSFGNLYANPNLIISTNNENYEKITNDYIYGIIILAILINNLIFIPIGFVFELNIFGTINDFLESIEYWREFLFDDTWKYTSIIPMNKKGQVDNYRNFQSISMYPIYGTIGGCVVGCYFLALDWYRPWQDFPLPCIIGMFYGNTIGSLLVLFKINCLQMKMEKTK